MKECYLCHRVGVTHRHHVYSGSYRKIADRLGLIVDLCPYCHEYVHSSGGANAKRGLQIHIQEKFMRDNGWTKEQWLQAFGKSWI